MNLFDQLAHEVFKDFEASLQAARAIALEMSTRGEEFGRERFPNLNNVNFTMAFAGCLIAAASAKQLQSVDREQVLSEMVCLAFRLVNRKEAT